ncbi:class I SAM-dependent methyltransferase [Opitutales bacterium ASA1]|uniref:class I SAM-dependent methyltransferase n=1 Tax=Congregicoccus parvus TaxID=3081749 RepID=UPI002B304830|nr:class I SAM-dependent methyltransferase [Opitutales bacterium ASA1]
MDLDEYRKLAAVEDRMWYFHALNRRVVHWLRRLLPHGAATVLDAGCGTGGLIKRIREAAPDWRIVGLDFSPTACRLARERTGVDIREGSIVDLPFDANAFDAVVSADVVCQVDDGAGAIREFARVVRPGGAVLVNVPAYRWLWSYHDDTCHTRHRYTRGELVRHFRAAGLEVVYSTYANLFPLPLIAARRKLLRPSRATSDVRLYPAPIEATFRTLAALEWTWKKRGGALPAGSSVFVVGRRTARAG